jgi:hypothetical protein
MITKEITICGKQVTLAYSYRAEIKYKELSDEDILVFVQELAEKIKDEQMPDIERSIYLIMASINANYKGKDEPVTAEELKDDLSPNECGMALGTILGLRSQFYHVPSDEPADKPDEGKKSKND